VTDDQRTSGIPGRLFALARVGDDRFRIAASDEPLARLFGGGLLAQTLAAAQRTVAPDRLAHSCHAYFVRPGDPVMPIDFTIERDRDGRSFSSRRVAVTQRDSLILTLSASFQVAEGGPTQQASMPDVPPPEHLLPQDQVIATALTHMPAHRYAFWNRDIGIDFRAVEPFVTLAPPPAPARRHFWVRLKQPIGEGLAEHQRMLVYLSDFYLMHTGLLPMAVSWADWQLQDASLDYAVWFHQAFRADDWLLYVMDSPYAGGARTMARGTFFARDGRLVASIAQEGLIRLPGDLD
jgi:acyl-CoA thioesterase-2